MHASEKPHPRGAYIVVFYVRSLKKLVMLTLGPLLVDRLIEIVCARSTATLVCAAMRN